MTQLSNNMRGAMLMMASMVAFTVNDAFMKALSGEVPLFQTIFVRGLITTGLLLAMALIAGTFSAQISRRDKKLILLRAVADSAAAFFFITALFNMPLANLSAILQALPLTVTLAGAVFLSEPVGWKRMFAILVGFVGVLLIVQPGAASFNSYSLYGVLAVVVVTFRDLIARKLSADVPSMAAAVTNAVAVTVLAGILTLGEDWVEISVAEAFKLSAAGVFIVGGYLFSVMTMRVGQISFVSPFRYTSLLTALVIGFLVFGEWPDTMTMIGSSIVVSTGIFTLYRERKISRRSGPVPLRAR